MSTDGFLFAEGGGAVLVVEELEHARRRGAPVIAEVAGYAETFDGHSMMMMEPSATQIVRMVRLALDDAGVSPAAIDYVNAHGTGTILNDQVECAMQHRFVGAAPLINSTKSPWPHVGRERCHRAAVTP
jgi:3-oxoacyl-[acyl-carrier-protein] synthase II